MQAMKLGDINWILNGALIGGPSDQDITGVCTDSRLAKPGDMFFALVADRDGHAFVEDAARAGAVAAVVSQEIEIDLPLIVVPDTLRALGDLARSYRHNYQIPVVAVTGSVGKTTTKEMIAAVLSRKYSVLKNDGNFNNEIGLPMTLFQLDSSYSAAVLEMAMRGPEEIRRLADIARPKIAVITNIGLSHVERLGSIEAIATAKSEILEDLPPEGLAVLNGDDEFYEYMKSRRFGRSIAFGENPSCEIHASHIRTHPDGRAGATIATPRGVMELELATVGQHNIWNAMAAIAVGVETGIELDEIKAALEVFGAPSMRANVVRAPLGYTVINDAYNASPASMTAALRALASMEGDRKIAVLGDMLELGEYADAAHIEVGRVVKEQGIDRLITVGELGRRIGDGAAENGFPRSEIRNYDGSDQVAPGLRAELRPGDVILVKGSRMMKMETIVEGLLGE
ncbi:MAG: UDP-N-acetylmuramoyl-tripeptide--D-alanyl-D-alanine ligase [Armatimonadota bacterium]|nr:UDP-N-acetylmuramoyl-tripeptide--D-alanyl-D-alanine ligase [Armatimonadota bacterium]